MAAPPSAKIRLANTTMKRISAKGSQTWKRYDRTAGCDVDKNVVVIALYNAETERIIVEEFKQTNTGAQAACDYLLGANVQLAILESTATYHWLFFENFRAHGLNAQVINPLIVKSLLRVEGKSDKADATTLARLAANFTLRTSNMPDSQQQHIRLLMRQIDNLKAERTRITNRVAIHLSSFGFGIYKNLRVNTPSGLSILSNLVSGMEPPEAVMAGWKGKKAKINELIDMVPDKIDTYVRQWLDMNYRGIIRLNEEVTAGEEAVMLLIDEYDLSSQVAMMTTAPSVNAMLAMRIIGEHGVNFHERYHSAGAFAKAIGVCPSNEVSGGKLVKRKTSHGNIHTKIHLLNCVKAWLLTGKDDYELLSWFARYRSRASYKKATSAVARKVAEGLYHMSSRNETWQPSGTHQATNRSGSVNGAHTSQGAEESSAQPTANI